jgi:hypothetical protein
MKNAEVKAADSISLEVDPGWGIYFTGQDPASRPSYGVALPAAARKLCVQMLSQIGLCVLTKMQFFEY